ncbi:MAG: GDSL-type esterase/lipase family protein [Sporolactobacillus sp.]
MKKKLYISLTLNILFLLIIAGLLVYGLRKGMNRDTIRLKSLVNPDQVLTVNDRVYKTRHSIFYSLEKPSEKHQIIFLGDSITQNCPWSELLDNQNIINRGISGDTTSGIRDRLSNIVYLQPKKIFIMAGINDFSLGRSVKQVTSNYEKIVRHIRRESSQTEVYIQSTLPINNKLNKYATTPAQITDLDKNLELFSKREGVVYINLYPSFVDSTGHLKVQYTFDGTHLNGKGYLLWKSKIEKYIRD